MSLKKIYHIADVHIRNVKRHTEYRQVFEKMFEEVQDSKGNKMYQMVDSGIPYDIKYKEVNRLEKVIEENDTEILTQLIKRREYFWT